MLAESGLYGELRERRIRFVDLNRDYLARVPSKANYTGIDHWWFPRTVLAADFVVSMPKVKTHHWAGIHRSILDINATVRPHFVIADGIVAMEGNGPLHGTHRPLGKIVLSDDPVAADFTCARLMGLDAYGVWHLNRAARFLGNGSPDRIDLLAESIPQKTHPFAVLPQFARLQLGR